MRSTPPATAPSRPFFRRTGLWCPLGTPSFFTGKGDSMFKRILIANRGEIAVRVFRACREMDIEPVVVYSQADADALHVQLAERAYCIGPARSADSYLNVDAILTVAQATGCDAIHPGYGFLSENAEFADACEAAGITFIGPSGDVIRAMGNKA